VPKQHIFVPDPPLAKPCVSVPSLRADPDCLALRLLRQLSLPFRLREGAATLGAFVPSGPKPSLTGSAVGVFAADTLAAWAISRPSGPGRWRISLANISADILSTNISIVSSFACLLFHYISHLLGSRVFNLALRDLLRSPLTLQGIRLVNCGWQASEVYACAERR